MAGKAVAGGGKIAGEVVGAIARRAAAATAGILLAASLNTALGAGEVRKGLSFQSRSLGAPMTYNLYLPEAYARDPGRRFPVVYLLHGYGANEAEWLDGGHADQTLDRLIHDGEIPPTIAVMPYGAKSWYVDSAGLGGPGNYETAIGVDLVDHVEHTYRAMTDRAARTVAGLSMGGYGALRLAFFHPERFIAVASLSGALHERVGLPGGEQIVSQEMKRADHWYQGAYGQPFDPGVYMQRNPFSRVAALSQIPTPPKILITAGDDDYFKLYEGSCALFVALRRAGLAAELRVDDGGHDWTLWRRQFPDVMRFFAKAVQQPLAAK